MVKNTSEKVKSKAFQVEKKITKKSNEPAEASPIKVSQTTEKEA